MGEYSFIRKDLAATLAVKDSYGHTPYPLFRHTPVRPVGDHSQDTVLPPVRYPADLITHSIYRLLPEVVLFHGDEPLLRRPEYDRPLTPPTVGIGVLNGLLL